MARGRKERGDQERLEKKLAREEKRSMVRGEVRCRDKARSE